MKHGFLDSMNQFATGTLHDPVVWVFPRGGRFRVLPAIITNRLTASLSPFHTFFRPFHVLRNEPFASVVLLRLKILVAPLAARQPATEPVAVLVNVHVDEEDDAEVALPVRYSFFLPCCRTFTASHILPLEPSPSFSDQRVLRRLIGLYAHGSHCHDSMRLWVLYSA